MLAWLTKNSIPAGSVSYVLTLPADEDWLADFRGAFFLLTQPQNWELDQGLTPDEMSDEWERIFTDFNEGVFAMIPVGCYIPFGGGTPPGGWLLCNGQAISRVTYVNLFSVIGVAFGVGDGSTTFNVPNLKGKVPVGVDSGQTEFDTLGESGGAKTHTLVTGELASHNHTQDSHNHTQSSHNHTQTSHNHAISPHNHDVYGASLAPLTGTGRLLQAVSGNSNVQTTSTNMSADLNTAVNVAATAVNVAATATNQSAGGGGSHNNLQPYQTTNYIIKY